MTDKLLVGLFVVVILATTVFKTPLSELINKSNPQPSINKESTPLEITNYTSPSATVVPTLYKSRTATATVTPTQAVRNVYVGSPNKGKVYIDRLSKLQEKYGQSVTISGGGFGSSPRFVRFHNISDPSLSSLTYTMLSGLIGWKDTEVEAWVPPKKGRYELEVEGEGSVLSNRVSFEVIAGVPKITSTQPDNLERGKTLTINGEEFGGNRGSVNLLNISDYDGKSQQNLNCGILSWSENRIECSLPQELKSGSTYSIYVETTDSGRTGGNVSKKAT